MNDRQRIIEALKKYKDLDDEARQGELLLSLVHGPPPQAEAADYLAPLRELLRAADPDNYNADVDPNDNNAEIEAVQEAVDEARQAAKLTLPADHWEGEPQPRPVLWRDGGTTGPPDPVLSAGEVAVLASAGGLGKSYLALALAVAASEAAQGTQETGAACGLRVKAGPVVLVSYEDSPVRIWGRLERLTNKPIKGVSLWPDPAPLWRADPENKGESGPCDPWARLWGEIRETGPALVVVDPVSSALENTSVSESGPVRAFLRALTHEAERAQCGVLLVAHDTKASRNSTRLGAEPGAGAVAGSAAWYDGARGVLALFPDPRERKDRILECLKANYGPYGWGAKLTERAGESYSGHRLALRMSADELESWREDVKKGKESVKKGEVWNQI